MLDQNTQTTCGIVKTLTNKRIISELIKQERKIIEFPMLKTEGIKIDEKSQKIIENLHDFDWLIFTDVLAVEYFLEILNKLEFDLFVLDNLRVCSLGESVSDRLRFVQIHSDIIPSRLTVDKIFDEIFNYIIDEDELMQTKYLILKGDSIKAEITEKLKAKKVFVKEFTVYKYLKEKTGEFSKLKTLLIGGAIDEFIFNSPIDLLNLKQLFKEDFRDLFAEINVLASDEGTFRFLIENGLKPKMFSPK